jgi:Beta-lactamase enzyme family
VFRRRFASWTIAGCAATALLGTAVPGAGAVAPAVRAEGGAAKVCVVPGTGKPLDRIWHPDMLAARAYNDHRTGDIAFAVRTDHRFYGYRPDHVEWSASVVKAMLMVAYLDRPSVASRALDGYDASLLVPMITRSDNTAAQNVRDIVGNGGLQALADRVGMTHFATDPIWGKTRITPRDQTRFFLHIDSYVSPRHQAYAMHLLASITPSQRWGIGEVAPKGWKLYFKGGWGYGTGLLDHQVALLVRGCARVSIAVLTMHDGSHAYGKDTLRGIFSRLLRGFPTGAVTHRRSPHHH